MDPKDIVTGLSRLAPRGPGSDAERRASQWLTQVLRDDLGREVDVETVWVRPYRAVVLALHAAVGVAASVVAASQPEVGLGLAVVALVSWCLDQLGLAHLGRRLTPERATQNLVSPPTAATRSGRERIVRLLITAPYDAPRTGVARRPSVQRLVAGARRITGGRLPSASAAVALALAAVAGLAGARVGGVDASWVGVVQLVPTVVLLIALGLAVDAALSHVGPGANDPASGAGVAIALAAALDRDPPKRMGVELVLAAPATALPGHARVRPLPAQALPPRGHRRDQLRRLRAGSAALVDERRAPVPLRFHPRMRDLAARVGGAPHRGREGGGGWRARRVRWPAITIGCLEDDGWPPDSGRPEDTLDNVDPAALRGALDVALNLVRALDEDLGQR